MTDTLRNAMDPISPPDGLDTPAQRLEWARRQAGFRSASALEDSSTYRSHENGTRSLTKPAAQRYAAQIRARGLPVRWEWLLVGGRDVFDGPAPAGMAGAPTEFRHIPAPPAMLPTNEDAMVPIRSGARGGDDQEMFLDSVLGYVPRPFALRGVKEAYAVQVVNDSMIPRYYPGFILFVNPFAKLRRRHGVVIYKNNDAAIIKEYLSGTKESGLKVAQFNPARDFTIPAKDIVECHAVVFVDESGG